VCSSDLADSSGALLVIAPSDNGREGVRVPPPDRHALPRRPMARTYHMTRGS
jgi:hypothetical protein